MVRAISKIEHCDWVTAKLTDRIQARKLINRLECLRYDFQVVAESDQFRILVDKNQIEEVMHCLQDQVRKNMRTAAVGGWRKILLFMLLGMFAGSLFCEFAGIPAPASQAISGFAGFVAMVTAHNRLAGQQ